PSFYCWLTSCISAVFRRVSQHNLQLPACCHRHGRRCTIRAHGGVAIMGKITKYVAKQPDENGFIHYTDEEHSVWNELITRQLPVVQKYACDEYLEALEQIGRAHV